ncbi:tRNA (guanosine(46)-N7)-methyltransferase TrmB [Candidatus Xianfuyuplasma coldseepsis]|uniref:tRNA (guanine-N(7)-)-methyltransferase n=1 Tax=Candidatus Xianfuyuplasma coldseepsis TaxID=2782163 RepID=A0A7L7KT09_9MOLU|nr:tRNA (guanosine(46)-N7)-methyltransferase TrmB [Xianfuyuplasma coldseepsis]QMS85539.1 tRNA (guanosine(46)-N7)-methyltransferase TrmB [Xianfuyuplasma coldseepsis]
MRLRYVKGARELIEGHPEFIYDDIEHDPIYLDNFFVKQQPLSVEIGMGKGQFIYQMAQQYPHRNFIGIEKFDSAIVKALQKLIDQPLDNCRLIRMDAQFILDLFQPQSIERIYLNFSDPWPKARHEKRRLTNPRFLRLYQELLIPQGEIHFKTDNDDLFAYSLETMKQFGMEILSVEYDLHTSPKHAIISTEFEDKFVEQGVPIKQLIARFKEDNDG